ncbi:zinc finger protein 2 homolog [Astatotilapia calliptera]|uniref:zinc finger protein 2 homolog n=1 Tax=Astatotilapia calliptera TaxID=8154 RepID=UPI000E421546|nr:zinc finger protein 2 homolog [Astatotilapia calliptera]
MYVNERWCNSEHITVKEQSCTKDIELLAVSVRPYHLAREFSHVIVLTVYIPPSADATAASQPHIYFTADQVRNQLKRTKARKFAYRSRIGVDDAVIYLVHRSLSHLEQAGSTVRIVFFDFSSAFNTIQPALLRGKLEGAGVGKQLTAWTIDYLTNRPQYVRLHDCVSEVVICSTGAPQGTVLSPFLFSLYTSDFCYNSDDCHIQKFSDDTAIIGCVSDGNNQEYRGVISDFVGWCETNVLQINASKTKEMIIDFRRKSPPCNTVACWGSGCTDRDRSRIDKLVRRSSSMLGCPLESVEMLSLQDQHGAGGPSTQEADKPQRRKGEKKYTCDECGKAFTRPGNLKTHQLIHSGVKAFNCDLCGKSFTQKSALKTHQSLHSGIKAHTCDQCGKSFTWKQGLERHKLIHSGVKAYTCDQCDRSFTQGSHLRIHQVSHSGIKAYSCDICGRTFSHIENRNKHQRIHTGQDVYCCDQCGKRFVAYKHLQIHKFSHTDERPYKCDLCDKAFNAPYSLKAHQQIHTRKRLFKCSYCEKQSDTDGCSSQLCRCCGGGKEFFCDFCGKMFSQQTSLKTHQRRHTRHKLNYCNKCGKGFPTPSTLKRHELIHSGVKKHLCDQCGSSFISTSQLKRHKRVHTGEKPYKCRHCDKSFSHSGNRNLHEATH